MQNEQGRRRELSTFLRQLRARVRPDEAGFGNHARRRVPGLRREEVAELIGVSDVWYARCESGRARFSLAALDRLAKGLSLASADRCRLFSLARPELAASTTSGVQDEFASIGSTMAEVNRFARTLMSCSTSAEVGEAVVRGLDRLVIEKGLAYWETRAADDAMLFEATSGHKAEMLRGYRQAADAIPHIHDRLLRGEFVYECDLTQSPSADLRGRVGMVGTYAYFGRGVVRTLGSLEHIFGFANLERHEPTPLERHVCELMATMVELALR